MPSDEVSTNPGLQHQRVRMSQSAQKKLTGPLVAAGLAAAFLIMLFAYARARAAKELETNALQLLASLHLAHAETQSLMHNRGRFNRQVDRWDDSIATFSNHLSSTFGQNTDVTVIAEVESRMIARLEKRFGLAYIGAEQAVGMISGNLLEDDISKYGLSETYGILLNRQDSVNEIRSIKRLINHLENMLDSFQATEVHLRKLASSMAARSRWYGNLFTKGAIIVAALAVLAGITTILRTSFLNRRLSAEIVEREAAINALTISERNLASTLNAIRDAVIVTDASGGIQRMNPVAVSLLGLTLAAAKGKHMNELVSFMHHETGSLVKDPALRVLNGIEVNSWEGETALKNTNGTQFRVAESATLLRDHNGRATGAVVVLHDVTDRCLLEEQFRQSQKMESVGKLAGGIAHDFNNMLGGILGFGELLVSRLAQNQQLHGYAEQIVQAASRASDLTEKLLAFSRKGKVQSSYIDAHKLLGDTIGLLEHSVDRIIRIETDFQANKATFQGDAAQLQNAFLNLGLNARDAMSQGGSLTYRTENIQLHGTTDENDRSELAPGDYLRITVKDEGCGIPDTIIEHVFEPFFTTKSIGQGTGLGLSAVYGTVCDHEGAIRIDSRLGQGTSIMIDLPVCDGKPEQANQQKICWDHDKLYILVVDDEAIVRDVTSELLKDLGFAPVAVGTGKEALELFTQHGDKISGIVLDRSLPDMSGETCLGRFRSLRKDIGIIIASGAEMEPGSPILNECIFLRKPFYGSELKESLGKIIAKSG